MVCRQLRYQDALIVIRRKYGQGTGPLWFNSVQCNSTEADLLTCRHNGIGITITAVIMEMLQLSV